MSYVTKPGSSVLEKAAPKFRNTVKTQGWDCKLYPGRGGGGGESILQVQHMPRPPIPNKTALKLKPEGQKIVEKDTGT